MGNTTEQEIADRLKEMLKDASDSYARASREYQACIDKAKNNDQIFQVTLQSIASSMLYQNHLSRLILTELTRINTAIMSNLPDESEETTTQQQEDENE